MKKYLLLLALVCLLGNRALAQTKSSSSTSFTHEVYDFTQLEAVGGLNNNNSSWNGNNLVSVAGMTLQSSTRISVDQHNYGNNNTDWNIWTSDQNQCSYFQRASNNVRYVYINNLHVGDIVRIWCQGDCRILSDNTASHDSSNPLIWDFNDPFPNNREQDIYERQGVQLKETLYRTNISGDNNNPIWEVINQNPNGNELKIVNDHENGSLVIKLATRWAGILKVEIDAVNTNPRYDYDPSLEVYDMFQTRNSAGNTGYTATESAGFNLNNNSAYYLKFTNNDLSLNERFAVSTTSGWTFARGIQAPNYSLDNDSWYNLSICNLREGDRVVIYYTGDAPIFSSNGNNGDYTGNAAFKDTWNDGMLDTNEGDYKISKGNPVEYTYCRDEGNIARDENTPHVWIYTSYPYVMMENGHLDLAIRNGNRTRIVKIKIYSDHQAMMVDDYNNTDYTYTSYFNITGQLQAKEHIVPGGLEVHVGNDNADQHANVVFSKEGPVSYVKAVDGFKLPGITKVNGAIQNDFNLANHAPETGTYYKFIPEADGKMTVRFKAASLNYYRWNLPGDAIYFDDPETGDPINGHTGWSAEFDRANEWPVDRDCPYYLKVQDGNQYYQPSDLKVSYNNGETFSDVGNNTLQIHNGNYCTLTLDVKAGKTYYLYGAWSGTNIKISPRNDNNSNRDACGVAQLLWVEFAPENKIYPLAKWVPNNTMAVNENNKVPNPDDPSVLEGELATVIGYVGATITVKKMSGNIIACRPYIKRANSEAREGKLMIDGITFNGNPGGTILIKIGDPEAKTSPLYALTIAYSTDPQYNGENGKTGDEGRGHTWDLTTNSLYGMKWDLASDAYVKSQAPYSTIFNTNTGGYATPTPYGTYFKDYYANEASIANFSKTEDVVNWFKNNNGINTRGSLLEEEIDYNDDHGIGRSDWTFNYNLVYGDKLYDPIFSNKYDMEGDNADMIWDTEGTVFKTSANQSVIFNEFGEGNIHESTKDPDRYVGILEGGEFRIPWLMKNDRVIIYMGTGKGRYTDEVKFNIRGAYDAVHDVIDPADDYIVGGSHWDGANGDKNYRGCYHFFATGNPNDATKPADMVFKMKEGSLCKIYKIQIYRGDRIITNEIVDKAATDNQFLLYSTAADPNEDISETNKNYTDNTTHEWALQYLGKDQQLANGTGKNTQKNEIIAQTGKYSGTPTLTNNLEVVEGEATSKVESFTYKHQLGEIGTFRVRGKDMEKNMNYVADYADHNVTIAYQETQKYPYTWDFKDMVGYSKSDLVDEDAIEPTTMPEWFDDEDIWKDSYEYSSEDLSLWETDTQNKTSYYLRLNSQEQTVDDPMESDNIFETAKDVGGNQLWAKDKVIPETKGLWFYTDDNLANYGDMIIYNKNSDGGMQLNGNSNWAHKLVIPNVPQNAAVYLRMAKTNNFPTFTFVGSSTDCEIVTPQVVEEGTDYILAVQNNGTKRNLVFALGGYELKKLAVSEDPKQIGKTGYATESRARNIDHNLTAYLTGKKIKAYTAKLLMTTQRLC